MKRLFVICICVALIGTAASDLWGQERRFRDLDRSRQNAARYGWMSSYRAARDVARRTGKPMMLVFRCVP